MSFALHKRKRLQDELAKVVRQELRKPIHALTVSRETTSEKTIHQSRTSIKKVRAVVSLLEQAGAVVPRKDRKRLKSAARAFSRLRDSTAVIDSLERVHRRYPAQLPRHTYRVLRRSLVGARHRLEARARRDGVVAEAAGQLAKTNTAANTWTAPSLTVVDLVPLIAASYRGSREALTRSLATGRSATLHRWRKQVKTLWYQLRLITPLAPGVEPLIADLKRLETDLGDHHNLVVLEATLRSCRELRSMRGDVRQVARLAASMRASLRQRALALGLRVHARTPAAFGRSLHTSLEPGSRRTDAA